MYILQIQHYSGFLNLLYSKTCVKLPLKIDKTKIFRTNGSLMEVESIEHQGPRTVLMKDCP